METRCIRAPPSTTSWMPSAVRTPSAFPCSTPTASSMRPTFRAMWTTSSTSRPSPALRRPPARSATCTSIVHPATSKSTRRRRPIPGERPAQRLRLAKSTSTSRTPRFTAGPAPRWWKSRSRSPPSRVFGQHRPRSIQLSRPKKLSPPPSQARRQAPTRTAFPMFLVCRMLSTPNREP